MSEVTPSPDSVGVVEPQTLRLNLPPGGLRLERGGVLPDVDITYERCGTLNPAGDNVIYVCHALTGDAHVTGIRPGETRPSGWWQDMIGPGLGIDTHHYHIVCANILGGCKGTTGPASINPATGTPYGSQFPEITVGDIVTVQRLLLDQLGIACLAAVVGGSFGGMQALEWAIRYPDFVGRSIVIAAAASLNTQALAFDIIGRQAIVQDPAWRHGDYYDRADGHGPPRQGLGSARKLAHVTYLSQQLMETKFGREKRPEWLNADDAFHAESRRTFRSYFQIESYLEHQGAKFVERFDANSYLHITRAMDDYDLEDAFGSLEKAFARVEARMLIVALSGDWLFKPEQSAELVTALIRNRKRVSYCHLDAPAGHDAFLTHIADLKRVIRAFLPWVGTPETGSGAVSGNRFDELEDAIIVGLVQPGSRVLDLGCGDGDLISRLERERQVAGTGVDIDLGHIVRTIDAGHNALLEDINDGLQMIPDDSYDVAVLGETLQVVLRPRDVLHQILRVAREAVVAFPNFGYLPVRGGLLLAGRMPKAKALPYEWYDTPNIHLFTLADFLRLCAQDGITVNRIHGLSRSWIGRLLCRLGFHNLGADRVIAHVTRPSNTDRPNPVTDHP